MTMTVWMVILGVLFFAVAGIFLVIFFAAPLVVAGKRLFKGRAKVGEAKAKTEYGVPYFPNVTMGWNSTPRCDPKSEWAPVGYPFMNTIGNNTPENFKSALLLTKEKLLEDPDGTRILNINCWNEWTEGSYLEPDTIHGMSYLRAILEVFTNKHEKIKKRLNGIE